MKTTEPKTAIAAASLEDDLLQLEMKVAQRADELSQREGGARGRDLEHWLQAEREIFLYGHEGAQPALLEQA